MKPVVFFPQPDYLDVLRSTPRGELLFTVREFDEGSVLHVTARRCETGSQCNESERRVIFAIEESCPEQQNLSTTITDLLQSESAKGVKERRLVMILPREDNSFRPIVFVERVCCDESSENKVEEAQVLLQPSRGQLYSRSKGILESSLLEECVVAVIGLGSGGSYVAVEIAKAGVGKFVLVDHDRLELHNIARHVCGLSDLGRLKVNAMKDLLLNKNPFIEVKVHNENINNIEKARAILSGCNLIIAATENVRSRLNINQLSIELGIPAIYGKCGPRAVGGDVLRVLPNAGPCFSCIYSGAMRTAIAEEEITNVTQARESMPQYTDEKEIQALVQVGLSSDIIPISNMIIKLAIVELCRGRDSSLAPLENDFKAPFYIWANRREGTYDYLPEDGFHKFDQPSILRWYPVNELERREDCKACGKIEASDEDMSFFGQPEDKEEIKIESEKPQPEDKEENKSESGTTQPEDKDESTIESETSQPEGKEENKSESGTTKPEEKKRENETPQPEEMKKKKTDSGTTQPEDRDKSTMESETTQSEDRDKSTMESETTQPEDKDKINKLYVLTGAAM